MYPEVAQILVAIAIVVSSLSKLLRYKAYLAAVRWMVARHGVEAASLIGVTQGETRAGAAAPHGDHVSDSKSSQKG